MAFKFFVIMRKRADGHVYCELHKTDEKMYLIEEEAAQALDAMGDLSSHFHVVPVVGMLEADYDSLVVTTG